MKIVQKDNALSRRVFDSVVIVADSFLMALLGLVLLVILVIGFRDGMD